MKHLVNVYSNKKINSEADNCVIMINSMSINNPDKNTDDAHYLIIRLCSNDFRHETERFILEIPKKIIQDIAHTTAWNGRFIFKALIQLCECGYNSKTLCYPDCIPIEKYIIQNIIRTGFFYHDNFLHKIQRKKKNNEEFSYQGKTYIIS